MTTRVDKRSVLLMGYRELIEWDRKRRQTPIVFGYDENDTGEKTTEEKTRVDW